jgi:predicted ArsR family transcriptional regulator
MPLSRNEADLASVSSLDEPVRGRLYAFVSTSSEPVGRDEAATAVGIGRALAVYHLDKLVESGLLTASYRRPPGRGGPGAGRPAKIYARSGGEFMVTIPPREYEMAARLLVQAVAADRSGHALAALHEAARKTGEGIGDRHRAGPSRNDGLPAGLDRALSELGFEPWHDDAGLVLMRNCPFRRLAELRPEVVCQMNLALIRGLVAGSGAVDLHPALSPVPDQCCVTIRAATQDTDGTT